ncbi:hypothetical protein BDD12DRAFT_833963 [Trichophaea hybrida]|nr:hypothetical protein BDD12DRAFT_833963 [Trichophaea hybrida]
MTSNLPPPRPAPLPRKRVPYPHIKDLIARTNGLKPKDRASIKSWLDQANTHAHQSKWHKGSGGLDSALVDYLMAFTIVADIIPGCQEYSTFRVGRSQLYQEYQYLYNSLKDQQAEFDAIKKVIKEDNAASGVLSTVDQLATKAVTTNGEASRQLYNGDKHAAPEVRPKQGHLASKSMSSQPDTINSSPSTNSFEARFERLRNSSRPKSVPVDGLPLSLVAGVRQPQGPREMPIKVPQLQLNVKNGLPQMPAPTYSPSTSYGSPGGLSPPRSSARVPVPDASKPKLPPPSEKMLTPENLRNYVQQGSVLSVLMLDVRSREEYDQGHIPSRSIVCIEPIILREGMSGDALEDALIVGPNSKERELFKTRGQYDLVVYYDQSTSNTESSANNKALRTLHAALNDFSYRKPLHRPPLLLAGGLDAWIDLFGPQSLTLTVAEETKPTVLKTNLYRRWSREPDRTPTPLLLEHKTGHSPTPPYPISAKDGAQSSVAMLTEPMNIEEEQKWMKLLKQDSDLRNISVPSEAEVGKMRRTSTLAHNTEGAYVRTVEEFFQQYPASPNAQESMTIADFPSSPKRNTIIDHPFHVFTDVRNPEFHPPTSPVRPLPVAPRKSYSGVSERLGTVTPPVVPGRPPKIPIQSRTVSGTVNFNIGTTGLKNLGNTCYMNSILQCMSGTIPLSRYFLDGSYKLHINKDNPLGSRGVLAEAFATLIRHLWSGEYNFISPVTFKDVSGRLNETFKSDSQQDAQEFLAFLLDGLHEDLNPNASRQKLNSLTEEEERRRERLPVQVASAYEWQRYIHQNSSVAVNWLQGQLSSRLKCLTCGITSTTYNPFMYLSLPIPVVHSRNFTLYDCLKEFTKDEVLDGDDAWHCPQCKQPSKATKTLTITRLPMILIIHLKRFTNQGRWRDKLNTPINFPLVDLDLTKYVPPVLPADPSGKPVLESPDTTPPFMYDLYGIANHYGTLHGGHYTAFVRNSYKGVWSSFDDSKATTMDQSQVVVSLFR